jgi:uncharacterized protein YciI
VYYVTFYHPDPVPDADKMARLREAYPRHRANLDEFAKGGGVWMIGTFGDPATQGSMAIFRSRAAAETFMASDPFVLEGLVHRTEIREWEPLEFPPAES